MSFFIQESLALQVLLIMVHLWFKLLQDVLFSVQLFIYLFHFFLYHGISTVLLVLKILDDLWHHEFLSLCFLLLLLQFLVSSLQDVKLPFELIAKLRLEWSRSWLANFATANLLWKHRWHDVFIDFHKFFQVMYFVPKFFIFFSEELELQIFVK